MRGGHKRITASGVSYARERNGHARVLLSRTAVLSFKLSRARATQVVNDHLVTNISRLCCGSVALNQRINKVTSVVIKLDDVNLLADNFSLLLVMIPWELKTFMRGFR